MRALSEPSRLAAAVFLLLVAATIGAFFAAQALKHQPPLLRYQPSDEAFSPNDDGVKDEARVRFRLPDGDDVTVTILDEDGGTVARLLRTRFTPKGDVTVRWDGYTDDGLLAPEGKYRVRVGLRDEGRTDTLKHTIKLDLTAPRPKLRPVRGPARGPIVIDGLRRRSAVVRVPPPARDARFAVWRTDVPRPRVVLEELSPVGRRRGRWNGRIRGRLAPAGTYMITAEALDRAGNRGTAPRRLPPRATGKAGGGVGVLVRPLAIDAPLIPVKPSTRPSVGIDAGGRRYSWALRRADGERVARGRSRATRLTLPIPGGPAGVLVLTARTRNATARALVPVASSRPRRVLVVLPALTWQGRNDVDDTGDGLPDSLARERQALIERPFAGGRLPRGFRRGEAQLLAFLDRQGFRYELTTDLALARTGGVPLAEHQGVILAGDMRWLPEALGERLAGYVRGGGRVFSVGIDSLQRTLALGARTMSSPSERSERDFFGAQVSRPVAGSTALTAQSDEINLFAGTAGSLGAWDGWEQTSDVDDGKLVATAVADGGETVFVAYRLGRGLMIRPGVPGWSAALEDPVAPPATTTTRIWKLLRR